MAGQQSITSYLISFGVIALVIALRWRRMSRVQSLKLERLWILPAFLAVVTVGSFAAHPPRGWAWAICAGALALGLVLGWQRGKLMRIEIAPDTHALNQQASPVAILFVVALVVARQGARGFAGQRGLHIDPVAVTDILLAFALGLFAATRAETYLRGKALLQSSRDGRTQGAGTA